MMPHIFETTINGEFYRHYSLEEAVKTLLKDTPEEHWYWNMLRRTIKELKIEETFTLFNGSSSVKRVNYGSEETFFAHRVGEE